MSKISSIATGIAGRMVPALRAKACLVALLCALAPMVAWGQVVAPPSAQGGVPVGASGTFTAGDIIVGGSGTTQIQDSSAIVANAVKLVNYNSSGFPGFQLGTRLIFFRQTTAGSDSHDVQIERTANYSGGTGGFVNSALYVHGQVSAGTLAYEWVGSFRLDNAGTSADGSQNVALAWSGFKTSTGRTIVGFGQIVDLSGADPTTSSVVTEIDVDANGTDANANRIGVDIQVSAATVGQGGTGAAGTATYGVRVIGNGSSVATNAFYTATGVVNGFVVGATPTGNAFQSPGYSVDASGNDTALSYSPTGTTVPANGFYLSAAGQPAISAGSTLIAKFVNTNGGEVVIGGGTCGAADQLCVGQNANVSRTFTLVNTNAGAAATAPVLTFANSSSQTQVTMTLNSHVNSGGNGIDSFTINTGGTFNVNSGANAIVIGNSTGILKLGSSGMFTADASNAACVGALGPAGVHATVQKWLTITDNGGIVGFIPVC